MNACSVLAYAYDADMHCVACTRRAWAQKALVRDAAHPYASPGRDENGLPCDLVDREGNLVMPLFADAVEQEEYCGDCRIIIDGTEAEGGAS